jgi:hypothetical protein
VAHPVGQLALAPLHRYGAQLGLPLEPPAAMLHVPCEPAWLQAAQLALHGVLQQ